MYNNFAVKAIVMAMVATDSAYGLSLEHNLAQYNAPHVGALDSLYEQKLDECTDPKYQTPLHFYNKINYCLDPKGSDADNVQL